MGIILSAQDIYKTYYADSGEVHALNGVSADFEAGLFYAIIGRSGSGKSTLLHILSGLDKPTSGKVILNGEDLYAYSDAKMAAFRRRNMGFVFQQFNLLDEYTVLNNIAMPLKLDGKKPDKAFLQQVTELLGIDDKLKKYPNELSGGEQQRVAIARALVNNPQMIIADEPTGNLDPTRSLEIMMLLERINELGTTVLVVTHERELVDRFTKRVVAIENGRIISDETGGYYNNEATI